MHQESATQRRRPGIRLSLSAAIIAGLVVLGAGALEAGAAGAITTGGGGVVKLPPSCPSAVSLSTSYGYTYLTGSGLIVGLSGSGCSTSSHPVTITLPNVWVSTSSGYVSPLVTVTPSCPVTAPTDCTFSFSFSSSVFVAPGVAHNGAQLYLTEADAAAAEPGVPAAQYKVQFVASQPATGAGYSLNFTLWYSNN